MNQVARPTIDRVFAIVACFMLAFASRVSVAADAARIQESIRKGQQFIIKSRLIGPTGSIAALGYVKSGGDKKHAALAAVLEEILGKIDSGTYKPTLHHNYEAAVDVLLLEAVDSELFLPQIETIAKFLIGTQRPNGSWFYEKDFEPDCGDTSITQYALLGLWAATRAGILVPTEVWEKAARWHFTHQRDDGGFAYHPYESRIHLDAEYRQSAASMAAAGSSNLLIIRRILFSETEMDAEVKPAENKRRFGVLERFIDDKNSPKPAVMAPPTIRPSAIDKALKDSVKYTASHYIDKGLRTEMFFLYYMYSIERVAALLDVDMLGTKNWYDEGVEELLKRQLKDGSWSDNCTSLPATAFGLMFMSKATTTIVAPKKKITLLGGGLQTGGRGLPENLGTVQVKEGVVSSRKLVGQVDDLLIELERSAEAKVLDAQAAIVETIQLDQPEELIGQVKRLRKLAVDPRVEVRRTALWALGRTGDLSTAPVLIEALADPDLSVVREASLALCIISRRPEGCGKAVDPTEDAQMGMNDETKDEQRKEIIETWQKETMKRWSDWYYKVRPYDERDDRTTLKSPLK